MSKTIERFCDNPTFKNFNKIPKKNIIKLREYAELALVTQQGDYQLASKIIRYWARITIKYSYEDALSKLSLRHQRMLRNRIKT